MINVKISISVGELCDRISILIVKKSQIKDPIKLSNIDLQLQLAESELFSFLTVNEISTQIKDSITDNLTTLVRINKKLWDIEDSIRNCERCHNFGSEFINLARMVYHTNDDRHVIKRKIDELIGSGLSEEKEYTSYEKDISIT